MTDRTPHSVCAQTVREKQGPTLQETTSWLFIDSWVRLEQCLPSTERSPLMHTLILFFLPFPQVWEQAVHLDQVDHMGLPTMEVNLNIYNTILL